MGMIGNAPYQGIIHAGNMAPGAAVGNLGFTPLNKAGDAVAGPLDLAGNKVRDVSGTGKVYYNLTPHYDLYASGSTVGALVVDTAIPYNDGNMCAIKLIGFSYNGAIPWEISISGYFGENNFFALSAYSLGHPFPSISVARKTASNTISIILGSTSGTYGTTAQVERFMQSYSAQTTSNANGWTISRITSTTAYSSITSVPMYSSMNVFGTAGNSGVKAHAPGPMSFGAAGQGNYVLGWLQGNFSSANSYAHFKTNLWGGGSPTGNTQYIMGGFRITGYSYNSAYNIDDLIQFHNWNGSMASLVRTCKGTDVNNTAYVGSDGWVYLRLASGQYTPYTVDLLQSSMYPSRDIRVVSTTYSNSATL